MSDKKDAALEVIKPSWVVILFIAIVAVVLMVCMTVLVLRLLHTSVTSACACIFVIGVVIAIIVNVLKELEDRYLVRAYEYQKQMVEQKTAEYKFSTTLLEHLLRCQKSVASAQDQSLVVLVNIEVKDKRKDENE